MSKMIQDFQDNLLKQNWNNKKIILAISGGIDSMVMASLFHEINQNIVIAHFNYALRGADSEADQQLVESWSKERDIAFYTKKYELGKQLEEEGGNLQELARNLRYNWLEELRLSINFDFIATAHHQSDAIETLLFNFFKGTGIAGLHGILNQNGKIIRPILELKKDAIQKYAQDKSVAWRMDASNEKNDYSRNKIRNQILPLLAEFIPNVQNNLAQNIQRFKEVEMIYLDTIEQHRKGLIEKRGKDIFIPILKLKKVQPLATILYELLKPFGFKSTQTSELLKLIDSETGSILKNEEYKIIKNRNFLIITPNQTSDSTFIAVESFEFTQSVETDLFSIKMKIIEFNETKDWEKISNAAADEVYLDLNKLEFPLILRPWQQGDYFYPLGMNKKKKKVSRFLIDSKVPLHKKEEIWILLSKNKLVWILGFRLDERFKVSKNSKKLVHFKMQQKHA